MSPEEKKFVESEEAYVEEEENTPEQEQQRQELFNQLKATMLDEYQQREIFLQTINQSSPRKISLSLICAQLLSKFDAITISIWVALALFLFFLAVCIGLLGNINFGTNESGEMIAGLIAGACISGFFIMAILCFLIAQFRESWNIIQLLKSGYCSLGYLVGLEDIPSENKTPEKTAYILQIAYKDADGMIHIYKFTTSNHINYSHLPVLMVFCDINNPKNITIFERIPGVINYNSTDNIFQQSANHLFALLIPLAEILWFATWVYYFSL